MSPLIATLIALSSVGASIRDGDASKQNEVFQRFWGTDFVWKFDELPTQGEVADFRQPYSGCIYLDTAGGTIKALRKYDRAFNGGRSSASSYEQWDTTAYRKPVQHRAGLFGMRRWTVMVTPHWHGHCNGWAAATIRHAEPQQNVRRGDVVFTPADIKGLLAEIYIYNDLEHLAGKEYTLNAGTLHAVLANWLGRGAHPLGMEADPGREKWNYPVYGYKSSSTRRSNRQVDVKLDLTYAKDSSSEHDKSPRISLVKHFHYYLNLDDNGEIVGGGFYRNSSIIDMLWVPLRPKQGGEEGNERGNPHVNVGEVLAIWRDSVPEGTRKKWPIIDPTKEDLATDFRGTAGLVPVQEFSEIEDGDAVVAADHAPDTGIASSGDEPTSGE